MRRPLAFLLIPLVAGAGLAATAPIAAAVDVASPVLISEVYGGGGNSGATYTNDFIELYNGGSTAVDLSAWSVQYTSATGPSGGASYATTPLTGSIAPKSFYLVQEAKGSGGTTPLPTADVTGTIAMSATAGKVALVSNQTALKCATACNAAAGVVDFVGFGGANDYAGTGPAPTLGAATSAQRSPAASTNTGDNSKDFAAAAPTPKAPPAAAANPCAATPLPPECTPGPLKIQDVQGDGFLSPQRGNTVDRVPGVVTGVRGTSSPGFWIQQTDPDPSRTSASSGVFVFTGSAPTVKVGDSVLVSGTVSDYYPLSSGETVASTSSLSITEITKPTVATLSSGNALPAPVVLDPGSVPGLYAPTPPSGNTIETITPVVPTRSALEFWEAHEGMLVTASNVRVVGPGKQQYGEIYVTFKPDELGTPRGGTYIASYTETPTGRVLVMPVNGQVPAANVGDVLTGATTGPVDWSTFGGYTIAATSLGAYQDNHLQPTVASKQAGDQLAVATYNVENLAPGDPAAKYTRLGTGVVTNLASPDVVAVEEIQDNSGAADDGTVAADQTLTKLTAAIAAAGGPAYRWAVINPVNDQDGGQPGGNIRSVFLYNPDRVSFTDKPAGGSLDAVQVSTAPDGTASLSLNPGRVDPTNPAWTSSRKPLAGEFVFQGRKVIVVANHFNSKGGDQSSDGRYQPPNRSSEVQRTQQAIVLNTFVKQVLAADPNANVVLAGDFNDYQFSAPVLRLTDNGSTLTDLITTLPANQRYTYVYSGVSQVLDHIFLTKAVTDVEYQVVHVNAEFADQASDHDPQVVRIRPSVRQGTLTLDPAAVLLGQGSTARLAGWYPNRTFAVTVDGAPVGQVTTDASGAGALALPTTLGLGTHTVTATSATDGATATATLTVKAQLGTVVLSPPKIKSGKQDKVEVFGWSPGLTLTVLLDSTPLGTFTTDGSGYAEGKFLIPAGTPVGPHQIVVRASDGEQVTAALEVSR